MSNYIFRFDQLVEELIENDNIQLVNYHKRLPVSDEDILEVEIDLDFNLDPEIISFYKEMNGFQLRWIYKKNEDFDSNVHILSHEEFDIESPLDGYAPFDGYINIFPLKKIIDYASWENIIWTDDDKRYTRSFMNMEMNLYDLRTRFRPFDFFSDSESMAFYVDVNSCELKTLLIQDDLLDPNYSRITNFQSYIEFLLATKGLIDEREQFYKEKGGHERETLITPEDYWEDKKVNLNEL